MGELTMNDCIEVKKISEYIREWISKQPAVKEESLTDYLLFQLSEKVPKIRYKAFSRQEEAKTTGADWEWWFVFSDSHAYKLRIQAKKVFLDNYPHIAHTNRYGLQIEKLLKDAIRTNSIPLYAFYTNETGEVMCGRAINDEGVYMAGANNVYNSFIKGIKQKVLPQSVLSITNPLSCFFCCPLVRGEESFSDFFGKYYREENRENIQQTLNLEYENYVRKNLFDTQPRLGLHTSIPNYVSVLIEQEKNKESDIDRWYESEFKNQIKDLSAIVVYDARNKDIQ
jgi:hypothetical protein